MTSYSVYFQLIRIILLWRVFQNCTAVVLNNKFIVPKAEYYDIVIYKLLN